MLIKKLSIIVLFIILIFSLVACDGNNGSNDNELTTYDVSFKVLNSVPYPIENAEVVVEGETKYTNQYGIVDFYDLQGECSYIISKTGYLNAAGIVTSEEAGSFVFVTLEVVDETDPVVHITSPIDGAQLGDNDITIEWDITDESPYVWELYVGGATNPEITGNQDDSHTFTFDPARPDYFESFYGSVVFRVVAVDDQNNENSDSITVNIETRADLLPDKKGGYFCFDVNSENQIVFFVKNQGNSSTPSSTAKVIFYKTDSQVVKYIQIPPIEPGDSTNLAPVDIPSGVFNPDANFDIILDIYDNVDEADETNNEDDCIIIG